MIPYGIPGARWISAEALDEPRQLVDKTSEIVFYCAEPNEATSARKALLLARHGYTNVHPLKGGLEGWRQAGFVVEPLQVDAQPHSATGSRVARGASGGDPANPTVSSD